MKFSELNEADWPELQPYLDTCLLPVSGLLGREAPWEMADRAAAAGDWLSPLEHAFRGRTVTLPAYHYYDGTPGASDKLKVLCGEYRRAGFKYVVLVSGRVGLLAGGEGADLVVQPASEEEAPDPAHLRGMMAALWKAPREAAGPTPAGE